VLPGDRRSRNTDSSTFPTATFFRYLFYVHNNGPFPITITQAGRRAGDHVYLDVVEVRIGPAPSSGRPASRLPYTVQPHAYAAIDVTERFTGCLEDGVSIGISTLPISYAMFGSFHHDTTVVMPMTMMIAGPTDGAGCLS
jgi:hypothetical protein